MSKIENVYKIFLGFVFTGFLAVLAWLLLLLAGNIT